MSLTEEEIDLLRESLTLMQRRRDLAAEVFYENLFRVAPQLRPMFTEDTVTQTDKVLFAFGAIVAQVHDIEACRSMTGDLAARHVQYGVEPEHYAFVGDAVMTTLADVLKDSLTPEIEAAWRKAYDRIATAMIESAHGPSASAA